MNKQKGFTLIEFAIVVGIIGILTAIVVPNFIAMRRQAMEGATKENARVLHAAIEQYAQQHDGAYPTSFGEAARILPQRLVNAFTHKPTEPSNDFSPGSISYRYFPAIKTSFVDGIKRETRYEIHCIGASGHELEFVLMSGEQTASAVVK